MRSTAHPPLTRLRLAACLALLGCLPAFRPAAAQTAPWGWGFGGNPTAKWSPETVADYLLTGQPPHPAVCRIVAPEQAGTSLGSGVLVDVNRTQGLVLTNWHVIRESRSAVLVQFPDGFQSAGTVIRWDEAWDLAAIVIWKPGTTPVTLAASDPAPGEPLTIAGFGRGNYREETGDCTEYLAPGSGYPKEFVELRATARQGDSGGPIFNARRELAGVLFGQAEGRTIGSCSSRVRAFLAAAGSRGFAPTPIAEFSAARAVDRSIGAPVQPRVQLAAAADGSIQRSTHVPGTAPLPSLGQPAVFASTGGGSGDGGVWAAVRPILDPFTNGPALLSAAGGLALVFLGLRTMFGGRRGPPVTPSQSW